MKLNIFTTQEDAISKAVEQSANIIKSAIASKGFANIVLATGMTYTKIAKALSKQDIDWSKVEAFHLDEYVGISEENNGSFRKYIKDNFLGNNINFKKVHFIKGDALNLEQELLNLSNEIEKREIDLLFAGIGNNGHLAFNEPPCDFETTKPYIVVDLDDITIQQQYDQGWFKSKEETPKKAVTMSINQIVKAKSIILCAFGSHKKEVIYNSYTSEKIDNKLPSSILKQHSNCLVFLDSEAAELLK